MNLLRAEFRREKESGFALLRRIPSTDVRKFLDYFSTLNEPDRDALAEAMSQRALCLFSPSAAHPYQSGNVAFRRYVDALPLMWEWRYNGTRELRMMLAVAKLEPDSSVARGMTTEIRDWIEAIKPVKSTEIRRVVKLALLQLFASLTLNHEGPYWRYEGFYQGREVCVLVDYGARHHQLDYHVSFRKDEPGTDLILKGLNFERIFGLTSANWDCLEQTNLDQSVALLKDLIVYCAEVLNRLPAEYKQEEKN